MTKVPDNGNENKIRHFPQGHIQFFTFYWSQNTKIY